MSRIISTHWISLDGFISGPAGELDFVRGDGQLAEYEIGLVSTMGHLLFGRKTYEQLSFYWSQIPDTPAAADWEKVYAGKLNPMRKSVVSTSLQTASWADSDILRDAESVADLRARATGDILIYGSATLVQALSRLALIDEYHLLVHPVLLGGGTSLFASLGSRLNLKKTREETFDSSLVLNVYQTERENG
jgi:dihydrofolate reductase